MVHLMVARRWATGHGEYLDSSEFYLGAISPDAIHIRDHDDKSHKDEIHLFNWKSPHPDQVIEYWRERSTPFDIGYGVHVLTDGQWVPRYRERLSGMLKPDGKLDTDIYYNDTFVTDFALYHGDEGLRKIVDALADAPAPEDHPLLTADELSQWRNQIVKAYHGPCPKNAPVRFVTQDYVRQFNDDCIALIDETYRKAFGD